MIKKICQLFMFFILGLFCLLKVCHADVQQIGPNQFVAGVPTNQFQFFAVAQHETNWCWAASIEMVLKYHGLRVHQEEIVQRIFGNQVNQPAQPAQMLTALSGWAPDVSGGYSGIQATPYTINASQIVRDLAYKSPLIAGLQNQGGGGHAVVLTAITYSVDQYNNPMFISAIIRDPWPFNPSRQEIPWNEFQQRLTFLAHVYIQKL